MTLMIVLLLCLPFAQAKGNISKKKIVIDKEHLKSDFLGIFGSWAAIFSDAEMDFRYFEAHDYDSNKKLDGLELFTALGHDFYSHEEEDHIKEEHSGPEDIERQVDGIFQEHDSDNDGFLDYKEFLSVQRTYPDISGERRAGKLQ